jgi:hypothetical protein
MSGDAGLYRQFKEALADVLAEREFSPRGLSASQSGIA